MKLWVMVLVHCTSPQWDLSAYEFQVSSLNTVWVMLQTKFKNKNEQRAITPKVWCLELWFICTALLLNEIYLPMKFYVDAMHSFKIMLRTKKGRTDGQTDGRVNHYMPPFRGHTNTKYKNIMSFNNVYITFFVFNL